MANQLLEDEITNMFGKLIQSQQPISEPQAPAEVGQGTPDVIVPPSVVPQLATPAATPVVPVTPSVQEAPTRVDVDSIVADWDTEIAPEIPNTLVAPVQQTPSPIISELVKVLNAQKEDDVLGLVEQYKQKAETFNKVPADLQKAMEIANQGGNYLEYLKVSVVDWAKEDPITLYENYVIDQYTDPKTGMVDAERVDKILDKIDDDDKELRGKDLQRQYVTYQNQRKNQIEFEAKQQKDVFERSLKTAIDATDNISNFKLTPAHKAELYSYIMSGQDVQQKSIQERVLDAGRKKYGSKMESFWKTQVKNATQRQMLEQATFPKLNATSTPANIQDAEKEQYDVKKWIDDLAKQRGFGS